MTRLDIGSNCFIVVLSIACHPYELSHSALRSLLQSMVNTARPISFHMSGRSNDDERSAVLNSFMMIQVTCHFLVSL